MSDEAESRELMARRIAGYGEARDGEGRAPATAGFVFRQACYCAGKSAGKNLGEGLHVQIKWKTIAPLGIWLAIYLTPVPAGLDANQWHYFAVFAAVIAGLILESM